MRRGILLLAAMVCPRGCESELLQGRQSLPAVLSLTRLFMVLSSSNSRSFFLKESPRVCRSLIPDNRLANHFMLYESIILSATNAYDQTNLSCDPLQIRIRICNRHLQRSCGLKLQCVCLDHRLCSYLPSTYHQIQLCRKYLQGSTSPCQI